ncbi:MAG: MerR family transcriptional regulator [Alkalilacustris sp.]
MSDKAPEAFRTIGEVAEHLRTPAHVLRFWESKFPQIKPVKRAGGRRYYRPADVALLAGIKQLLHDDGMTIRGVQKLLREHGARHVATLAEGGVGAPAEPRPNGTAAPRPSAQARPAPQPQDAAEPPPPALPAADIGSPAIPAAGTEPPARDAAEPAPPAGPETHPATDPAPGSDGWSDAEPALHAPGGLSGHAPPADLQSGAQGPAGAPVTAENTAPADPPPPDVPPPAAPAAATTPPPVPEQPPAVEGALSGPRSDRDITAGDAAPAPCDPLLRPAARLRDATGVDPRHAAALLKACAALQARLRAASGAGR